MAEPGFHVIIVGAGTTGLLIAQGLKKAGISATVYEKYSDDKYQERSGKWTMALHWSIPHIQACLPPELFEQLKSVETNPWGKQDPKVVGNIPLINGRSGELLANVPMPSPRRIVRGKLRDLFNVDVDVRYGQSLTDVHVNSDGVTATFNNGETVVNGTVLVGADGARSAVRGHLVDEMTAKLDKANTMILLSPHPYQNTNIFSTVANFVDPEEPETWVFQFSLSIWTDEYPPASPEERRHLFKSYLSTYCEPYRSVAAWLADDIEVGGESVRVVPKDSLVILDYHKFHYWGNITPWNNHDDRVTLAGDAAHPMVPFRAQGLNNAVEDARLYVDAIRGVCHKNKDFRASISAYDESAFRRGKADIAVSNDQMFAYHYRESVMNGPLMRNGYSKNP
ncbi:uncharacterized protein N7477_004704 [Penicillium maclennaniae]|uniref:uncharacterized protein n=1 Tax=Penicillium maclennaniae TaxID=1343394 RepID=UPI0025414A2E|nr:uncharacterized protein N7477_004704 [Penicillium maclennaniae]KAJ5674770.1 hypothetical protein N7477_004704 [Penicillium maclennaniae]